jgi:stage II sporulation protein D
MRVLAALLIAVPLGSAPVTLKVQVARGDRTRAVVLPLEQYVAGVLAGEGGVLQSKEALKALSVAARTYAVRMRGRHSSQGFDFCDTTHCQRFDLDAVTPRLASAAEETAGELLWFEGKPALAYYSRDCGGRTEDARQVWPGLRAPYLISRPDPYCARSGASAWQWVASAEALAVALRQSGLDPPRRIENVAITRRSPSGRAETVVLSGAGRSVSLSASAFRFAVGRWAGWNTLRSDLYEVRSAGGRFVFQGSGAGHGVGLCQTGSERMGLEGHAYREILAFYYPGTVTGLTARGLAWSRLGGGDSITVLTTEPGRDAEVLRLAERLRGLLEMESGLRPPDRIEIRVYPDVETFRNATGEPGWVAARAAGLRIEMQPAAILRRLGALDQTLRHELLHVFVESRARPGLPVWFREGLVGWLDNPQQAPLDAPPAPSDGDLRQKEDPVRARRAQAGAAGKVAALADRYGRGAVLGWLERGLPPELTNSSSSQPPVKSR